MIQVVLLFLVGMAVLAIAGRIRRGLPKAGRCPSCGRYRIGSGPCPCGKGG